MTTLWQDELTHAHFAAASTGVAWRELDGAGRAGLLAELHPGNLRWARIGDELAMIGSLALPLSEESFARRRAELVEQVEAVASRMGRGDCGPARRARPAPPAPGVCDLLRSVALGLGWSVHGEGSLEIHPGGDADTPLRAHAEDDGVAIRADATPSLQLAPSPECAVALAVAALGLNARLSAARLRLVDAERMRFAAECVLPPDPDEDEVEHALEGVRHAAREARRSLGCLAHPAVARVYAAALELSPG